MKKVIDRLNRLPSVRVMFWAENPFDTSTPLTRTEVATTVAAVMALPGGSLLPLGRLVQHEARKRLEMTHFFMQHTTSVQATVSVLLS